MIEKTIIRKKLMAFCRTLSNPAFFVRITIVVVMAVFVSIPALLAQETDTPIPASRAFDGAPACSDVDLAGLEVDLGPFGIQPVPSPYRSNPEWKAIIVDSSQPPNLQPPQILEGWVTPPLNSEKDTQQASSEVAEEDLAWTHYTHDFTFKVIPDPGYQHLLASWVRNPGGTFTPPVLPPLDPRFPTVCPSGATYDTTLQACASCPSGSTYDPAQHVCGVLPETCPDGTTGTLCTYTDMEVEWDHASLMDEKEGFQRIWGAVPEFVWPAVGDRVWVEGRWIFDCGHPGISHLPITQYVRFSSEIHPPRALVALRLNHPALDSFPRSRTSAPNFPGPQSYLPVTGVPVDPATLPAGVASTDSTRVPLTEADIFVSPNGGAANDICSIVPYPCSNYGGHTSPIIDINDRNYVFDIYPPGTDYLGFVLPRDNNGNFGVGKPVANASLQYRVVDHDGELPLHSCGGTDETEKECITVQPIICLVDSSTPPPTQLEDTKCPALPANPTRVRVILPFMGTVANYFAKSILVGWDDVPASSDVGVDTVQVELHKFTVKQNGAGCCNDADWRVFVNVGGQYRYMSQIWDSDANGGAGIHQFDGGSNKCQGDNLTENGEDDCFQFDNTPWTVSVQRGSSLHVAVGGFIARGVEESSNALYMCRNFPGGCDSPSDFSIYDSHFYRLALDNDDRIGTYEFDLGGPDYSPPAFFQTAEFGCSVFSISGCSIQYRTEFSTKVLPAPAPPASAPLVIGNPNYTGGAGIFISAGTPMIPQTADSTVEGFQYRFHRQGGPLPTYATQGFPIHWTHVDLAPGVHSAEVTVGSANSGDGPYDFQYSAESFNNLLEPRHTSTVILDTTPPVTAFTQPTATQYGHSDPLVLNYNVSDGAGSGVQSFTPKMDGLTAQQFGAKLDSGQTIYLYSMPLGQHKFSVDSVDNVNNAGTNSVIFTITVTFASLGGDISNLQTQGCLDHIAQSFLAKFTAGQNAYNKGQIQAAINVLAAAIYEIQAQAGKHISTSCHDPNGRVFNPVDLLLGDIQYLQGILAGQLKADPIIGFVTNSTNSGISGVAVNLMNGKTVVASTTTDSAGFYYFADVSRLAAPGSYTVTVPLPKAYKSSLPASVNFTWSGKLVTGNFVLY